MTDARTPQLSVRCPWCGAEPGQRCATKKGRALRSPIHPARLAWWAVRTACCPACQVEPGIPCREENGAALDGAHPQREVEALKTAAGMGDVRKPGALGNARRTLASPPAARDGTAGEAG
jgi:hypothetical protein